MQKASGQALVEVMIAATVIIIVAITISQTIAASLRGVMTTRTQLAAVFLSRGDIEATRAVIREDWHNVSSLATSTTKYVPAVSGGKWVFIGGPAVDAILNGVTYTRWIIFDDVYRSTSTGDIVATGGYYDPSTIKVTTNVTWNDLLGNPGSFSQVEYLSRYLNDTYAQTDWSGGSVGESVSSAATTTFATSTGVDTTSTTGSIKLRIQ